MLGLRRPNFRSAKLVLFCLRGRNIVAVAMSRSQMLSMAILKQDMQFEDQGRPSHSRAWLTKVWLRGRGVPYGITGRGFTLLCRRTGPELALWVANLEIPLRLPGTFEAHSLVGSVTCP